MHCTSNEEITQLPAKATVDLAGKLLINSQLEVSYLTNKQLVKNHISTMMKFIQSFKN